MIEGVVLAGGRSRRMGRDKARLVLEGLPLYVRAARLLRDTGCSGVAVIGRDELPAHPDIDDQWSDLLGGEGPVDGLITALTRSEAAIVTVIGVDLPDVPVESLARTRQTLADRPEIDVVLLAEEAGRFALAGSWRSATALPVAQHFFANGGRSIVELLKDLSVATEVVADSAVINLNRPDEWEQRRRTPTDGSFGD